MPGKSGRFGAPDRFALKSGQPLCNFLRVKKAPSGNRTARKRID